MALQERLREWLRSLGYIRELPDSFDHICSPSTAHIWQQLAENIKPRKDVEQIRNNIVINRLQQLPMHKQHEFAYPAEIIETFTKKGNLEEKISRLQNDVNQSEKTLEKLLTTNNSTSLSISHMKEKIKEIEEKTFLLDKKSEMLEKDILMTEEMVIAAENLDFPVEIDKNALTKTTTETLQYCAAKMRKTCEAINKTKDISKNSTYNDSTMNLFKSSFIVEAPKKKSNRESLGLLPMDTIDDSFDEMFTFSTQTIDDSLFKSSSKSTDTTDDFLKKIKVESALKKLLYKQNRQFTMMVGQKLHDELLQNIKCTAFKWEKAQAKFNINKEHEVELYCLHVEILLEKKKLTSSLEALRKSLKIRKEDIYNHIERDFPPEEAIFMKTIFELQLEDVIVDTNIKFLQQQMYTSKESDSECEMHCIHTKITKANDSIAKQIECIENMIIFCQKVFSAIQCIRDDANSSVRKYNKLANDLSWATRLLDCVNSEEVQIFQQFPLHFHRDAKNRQDDCLLPAYIELDSMSQYLFTSLVNTTCSSEENIVHNVLELKMKLEMMQKLEFGIEKVDFKKYSMEGLRSEENFCGPLVMKLQNLLNSTKVKKVLSADARIKKGLELRENFCWSDIIPSSKLVDGHDFKYYEELFECKSTKKN